MFCALALSVFFRCFLTTLTVLSNCFFLSDLWLCSWTDSRFPDDPWLCFFIGSCTFDDPCANMDPILDPRPSTSCDDDSTVQGAGDDPTAAKRRLNTSEVRTMWNLPRIVRELGTRQQCINFAEEQGLVKKDKQCRVHRKPMAVDLSVNNTVGAFRCTKVACARKSRDSRANGTWFDNVKLNMQHIFYLMYAFAHCWTHDKIIHEDPVRGDHCLSRATIRNWFSNCRKVIVTHQLDKEKEKGKIGGPGKIVQIDKSQFGKSKDNKGRVEGRWVLGMIEDGSEDLRLEVCPDNIDSAEVLVPLIKKHVAEGTIVHTDDWSAYDCLGEHNYIHKKVNHTDPDNPTHTQRIQSQWRVVKRFFYKDNYNHLECFEDAMVEYIWRRNIINMKNDPFIELIKAIRVIYDPNK